MHGKLNAPQIARQKAAAPEQRCSKYSRQE